MTGGLVADSVGKRFGERKVLTSAYLHAPPGEIAGVVGRNGAGKSTLLKICAGVVRPDHGIVLRVGARHVAPRLHRLARAGLFFLSADREFFFPSLTLGQHLEALERRFGPGDRAAVLERLEIAHLERARPGTLSGGERRRAELALALVRRPRYLLADEPFRGIDPKDREVVAGALRRLAGAGCAVVLTGHELDTVLATADRLVWVHEGSTRDLGPAARAREDWRFRREYLGTARRRG